jgi:hypothetical protein
LLAAQEAVEIFDCPHQGAGSTAAARCENAAFQLRLAQRARRAEAAVDGGFLCREVAPFNFLARWGIGRERPASLRFVDGACSWDVGHQVAGCEHPRLIANAGVGCGLIVAPSTAHADARCSLGMCQSRVAIRTFDGHASVGPTFGPQIPSN